MNLKSCFKKKKEEKKIMLIQSIKLLTDLDSKIKSNKQGSAAFWLTCSSCWPKKSFVTQQIFPFSILKKSSSRGQKLQRIHPPAGNHKSSWRHCSGEEVAVPCRAAPQPRFPAEQHRRSQINLFSAPRQAGIWKTWVSHRAIISCHQHSIFLDLS